MTLHDVAKLFQRKLWLLLLVGILAAALAHRVLVASGSIPRFSTEAVIAVGGDAYRDVQDVGYLEIAEALMANYLEVVEMELVTGPVSRQIGGQLTAEQIAEALDVSRVEGTNLISIRATNPDPVLAATLANSVAAELSRLAPARWPQFVLPVKSAEIPVAADQTAWLPVILSVFAAVLLAIGLLLLYEFMRQPVYSEAQAEALFKVPVLASLQPTAFWRIRQMVGKAWLRHTNMTWWVLRKSCRRLLKAHSGDTLMPTLTSSLRLSRREATLWPSDRARLVPKPTKPVRGSVTTIVVTSANGHDSQALVATQLAQTWASTGEKVLLVDLDRRHPAASRAVLHTNPEGGFATLIDKPKAKISGLIAPDQQPGSSVLVLPAGTLSSVPGPASEAVAVESLLEQVTPPLILIISAPPATASAAALQGCVRADLTLVTIDAGVTRLTEANELMTRLNAGGASIGGLVVSHFPARQVTFIQSVRRALVDRLAPVSKPPDAGDIELDQGDLAAS